MKLGIFTDSHYCNVERDKTRFHALSLQKIEEAMTAFRDAGVDAVLCLGDIIDIGKPKGREKEYLRQISDLIKSFALPFYFIPGNHDYGALRGEEFCKEFGTPDLPYFVDFPDVRLILLDAGYRKDGRRFDVAGNEWTDSNLPPFELRFLEKALAVDKKCVVCLHENVDTFLFNRHYLVKQHAEVRKILRRSGNVSLVLQGHYHKGADHTYTGIRFLSVAGMVEGKENRYCVMDI